MARLTELEAEKIFKPETMALLKGKSGESLKQLLGDKDLRQVMQRSTELIPELIEAEDGYRDHLELLAADIATQVHNIIDYANIKIDAKIVPMGDLNIPEEPDEVPADEAPPEAELEKRSIIKKIQQGASIRGAFAFLLFRDYLDALDEALVEKYNEILKLSFGIYDNDEAIAMLLAMIAQKQNMPGGESKMVYDKDDKQFVIKARAICFPILVHEIVKGLYEIIGTEGFGADKKQNQAIVNMVDKLSGEPDDIRYGKFLYDAIVNIYNNSNINDNRVREIFIAELYKLPFQELKLFTENAIADGLYSVQVSNNGQWQVVYKSDLDPFYESEPEAKQAMSLLKNENSEKEYIVKYMGLTLQQKKWAADTMRDIKDDLKKDDTGLSGL